VHAIGGLNPVDHARREPLASDRDSRVGSPLLIFG